MLHVRLNKARSEALRQFSELVTWSSNIGNPEALEYFECVQDQERTKPYHILKALAKQRVFKSVTIERKMERLKTLNQ